MKCIHRTDLQFRRLFSFSTAPIPAPYILRTISVRGLLSKMFCLRVNAIGYSENTNTLVILHQFNAVIDRNCHHTAQHDTFTFAFFSSLSKNKNDFYWLNRLLFAKLRNNPKFQIIQTYALENCNVAICFLFKVFGRILY